MSDTKPQNQETERTPSKIMQKQKTKGKLHVSISLLKLQKIKNKEKVLTNERKNILPIETMQTGRV